MPRSCGRSSTARRTSSRFRELARSITFARTSRCSTRQAVGGEAMPVSARKVMSDSRLNPDEPIHIFVPGSAGDPRDEPDVPGVVIHRGPPLHPDDVTVVDGIPMTSPSRTLIDCAECMSADELRDMFARARERALLDPDALRASRARVQWRPSLAMLDEIIAEFCDG